MLWSLELVLQLLRRVQGLGSFPGWGFFHLLGKRKLLPLDGFIFPLLSSNLLPAFVRLGVVRNLILFWPFRLNGCLCSGCGRSCGSGFGSSWLLLLRAELCYMAELRVALVAWPSALYHYHHLPIPAGYDFRDGLKTFPR